MQWGNRASDQQNVGMLESGLTGKLDIGELPCSEVTFGVWRLQIRVLWIMVHSVLRERAKGCRVHSLVL